MKKTLINFIFVSLAGVSFVWAGLFFANDLMADKTANISDLVISSETTATPSPSLKPSQPAVLTLVEYIQQGIDLLKKSGPLKFEIKKEKPEQLERKQISLAILDTKSGKLFEKRVWVKEEDIRGYKDTGKIILEPDEISGNINVEVKQWNSFNSYFEMAGHPEMIIIANKYFLPSESLENLPERSMNKYTEIYYAPYSLSIREKSVIDAGKRYLDDITNKAFLDLDRRNVPSLSMPGKKITSVVTKQFIKNIMLIEHIDPDSYSISGDNGRELAERMLAIIGANKNKAYRYTGSPAGAYGLAQFIQPTYIIINSKYPSAGLIDDFHLGMADHVNAVKAMVLFFDAHKYDIETKINKPIIVNNEMLAASYNGGSTPVIKAINKFGDAWYGDLLRSETLNYIQKLRSITSLKIF